MFVFRIRRSYSSQQPLISHDKDTRQSRDEYHDVSALTNGRAAMMSDSSRSPISFFSTFPTMHSFTFAELSIFLDAVSLCLSHVSVAHACLVCPVFVRIGLWVCRCFIFSRMIVPVLCFSSRTVRRLSSCCAAIRGLPPQPSPGGLSRFCGLSFSVIFLFILDCTSMYILPKAVLLSCEMRGCWT